MLSVKEISSDVFELLERLPISKKVEEQLLDIAEEKDLEAIFETSDFYELFYKLNTIEYLAYSENLARVSEKEWQSKFINLRGY